MNHRLLITTFGMFLIALGGCEKAKSPSPPPSNPDFVRIADGQGTAKVWGISIDVANATGTAASSFAGANIYAKDKDVREELTIGDDVKIVLDQKAGKPITFEFNGKKYGTLKSGDKVSINKERNVTVNGKSRQAEADKPAPEDAK